MEWIVLLAGLVAVLSQPARVRSILGNLRFRRPRSSRLWKRVASRWGFRPHKTPRGTLWSGEFQGVHVTIEVPFGRFGRDADPPIYRAHGMPNEVRVRRRKSGRSSDEVLIGDPALDRVAIVNGDPRHVFGTMVPEVRRALIDLVAWDGQWVDGTLELRAKDSPASEEAVRRDLHRLFEAAGPLSARTADPDDHLVDAAVHEPNPTVAAHAMRAVGRTLRNPTRRERVLRRALEDGHQQVQVVAATELQDAEHLVGLAVSSVDTGIRNAALRALAGLGAVPQLVAALGQLLRSDRRDAMEAALETAIRASAEVLHALVGDLTDAALRPATWSRLSRTYRRRTTAALRQLLEHDGLQVPAEALVPLLAHPTERLVILACDHLGRTGRIEHVEALAQAEARGGLLSGIDEAARAAIQAIQARGGRFERGGLSMAEGFGAEGALSVADGNGPRGGLADSAEDPKSTPSDERDVSQPEGRDSSRTRPKTPERNR